MILLVSGAIAIAVLFSDPDMFTTSVLSALETSLEHGHSDQCSQWVWTHFGGVQSDNSEDNRIHRFPLSIRMRLCDL